jgi:polar amino acid transport system permease protein
MFRLRLEKTWVQIAVLLALLAAGAVYWGFFFDFGYTFQWDVLYTRNPTYGVIFGLELVKALGATLYISLWTSLLALGLGLFFGLGRLSAFGPLRWTSTAYVEFFRNTPLLVQLFFWYFALPQALPEAAKQWMFSQNFEMFCAVAGLSMYTGSFLAEVIRAGLQSIPKGLLEAAYSSGLSYLQVLLRIILPLAFRQIIPPLGSELLNNMKNSSLAMVVGVAELTWSSQQVESLTFRGFEATTAATVLYLATSLAISALMNAVNRKLKVAATGPRSLAERLLDAAITPLAALGRAAARPLAWRTVRRRLSGQAGLRYSAAGARWRRCLALAGQGLALAGKAAFLGALGLAMYKVGLGLAGFDWSVVAGNLRALLVWRFPNGSGSELFWGLGGLAYSLLMALIAISASFFIGLAVGVGRTSQNLILRIPSICYIEFIRGNPLIIVIFWVYFFIPVVTGAFLDVFWSATLALTAFTGAYLAEIVRAGIENIPGGQWEAAYSTGLSTLQTLRRIVLPQALKQMIPAIVGQFIAIFKDTSLAYVIGVLELTFVAQGLNNRLMVHPFEIYTTVAALYFAFCYLMSRLARRLERRLTPEATRLVM